MLNKIVASSAQGISDFTSAIFNFASAVYNFLENLFYSVFSLARMFVLMAVETLFMPAIFYYSADYLLGMAGTNHWLGSLIIESSKKAVIGLLTRAEQLPLVGVMFTPAVLPWVIYAGIGKLIYSHFKQMWNEQNKIIKQQTKHLDPAQQPKGWLAYWVNYVQIFSTPAQRDKAYTMRLLLSVCIPTFLFLFRSFCGVNPAIALIHSGVFSLIANLFPYGLIGVAAEGGNFATGLMQRWQRVPPAPEPQRDELKRLNNPEPLQFTRQPQVQQPELQPAQPQPQQTHRGKKKRRAVNPIALHALHALDAPQHPPVTFSGNNIAPVQNSALSTSRAPSEQVNNHIEPKTKATQRPRVS